MICILDSANVDKVLVIHWITDARSGKISVSIPWATPAAIMADDLGEDIQVTSR